MGNVGSSSGVNNRRRSSGSSSGRRIHPPPPPPVTSQPETTANRYMYPASATMPYHNYPGYYPPPPPTMPLPLPAPYDHHHHHRPVMDPMWGRYPQPQLQVPLPLPMPYVEHQKAVTIRNTVNIKKETLRIEPDEENLGRFVVSFVFDATIDGSITILFFAKEGEGCILKPMKENTLPPVTIKFQQGLGQKFKQPAGTGIDFSIFEESELLKVIDMDVYPLAVKADSSSHEGDGSNESPTSGSTNLQITQAVFEKEKGEFLVKVVKQILWVNGMRYELQEIYGIGNSAESDLDGNDPGKECVICLSEPRDTTVLPCRHMVLQLWSITAIENKAAICGSCCLRVGCKLRNQSLNPSSYTLAGIFSLFQCMCSGCAKVLRFQTNRCPICRQPVERLLEIKVGPEPEE